MARRHGQRPVTGALLQRKLTGSPGVEVVGNQVKLGGSVGTSSLGLEVGVKFKFSYRSRRALSSGASQTLRAATEGYVAGFMAGMAGGDPAWFTDARAKGAAARGALVAKVREDPRLTGHDIGPDEILLAIAEHKDAFHTELYGRVKPQIASLYIQKWKQNLSFWQKTFTNEKKSGERNIRTRMGLPDEGELPQPRIGEPAPGAAPAG